VGPGPGAAYVAFSRAPLPQHAVPGRFYLGRLGEDANACDEVVLTVKPDWLELHCHGGVEVVRFIEGLFAARGVCQGSWRELTQAGGSRLGLLAKEQLLHAPTVKTAAILLDQVHGAFENTLAEILGALRAQDQFCARRLLARLVGTLHLGRHLVEPFRVVIAGTPNVGKSSLVNALSGYTRSLVSPIAGTTRDVVTTRIALDGWPVELIDTAGLHTSADALERQGMARTRAVLDRADLVFWVLDASAPRVLPPPEILFDRTIINKVDLPAAWDDRDDQLIELPRSTAYVSAKTGQGVTELCRWIAFLLGLEAMPAPGEGVAFTPELCEQIWHAYESLRTDRQGAARILEDIETAACGVAST